MGFFVTTCRRLVKEKYYTFVCIISLALGISGSILISLFLLSEMSFDRYHQNHNQIFRVTTGIGDVEISYTGYEIGPLLVRDNPQFLDYVRFRTAYESEYGYGDKTNTWENIFLADETVFDLFTLIPIQGDLRSAFQDPYSIAISESFARYYFGDEHAIGKVLSTKKFELQVTLVFEDLPENVTMQYDALLPFELMKMYQPDYLEIFGDKYLAPINTTYLHVGNNFDPQSMETASDYLFETYMTTGYQKALGDNGPIKFDLRLQKLSEIHFGRRLLTDESTGNSMNLTIFAAVAIALLVISGINYVNLTTARATVRIKEVAMKKILGASRENLIFQFLAESVFFVALAFAVGMLISVTVIELGYVEKFSGKTELTELFLTPGRLLLFVAAALVVGLLSGIYPALKLSRPSMMSVLKPGKENSSSFLPFKQLPLRQLLVFLQMGASLVIIACVFIMLRQANFLMETPLGFKKENQLVVQLVGADAIRSRAALMTELNHHSEIASVVEMSPSIGRGLSISIMQVEGNDGETRSTTTNLFGAGDTFLETMQIELVQGNMFRNEQAVKDLNPVLVNEAFVRIMSWDQPIGKRVGRSEVIGVVKDFHYRPLHDPIAPATIGAYNDGFLDNLSKVRLENVSIDLMISVSGDEMANTMAYIKETVSKFSIQPLIEVRLLTDIWKEMYDDETRSISLIGVFAGLSAVISLLGVAGLATYSAQQRRKEVAIRKVLGASVPNILFLLSTSLVKVITIAVIPAFAGAYYFSNIWLQRFAYTVEFSFSPYLLALSIVGLCSLAVLIMQTWQAARANPVNSLKYE